MARYFLESSVMLDRYLVQRPVASPRREEEEPSAVFARAAVSSLPPSMVSSLTLLETRGVLARMSRNNPEVEDALRLLEVEEASLEVWEATSEDWGMAMRLAVERKLKGADALQLAIYMRARIKHNDLMLATADRELLDACRDLDLAAINPRG